MRDKWHNNRIQFPRLIAEANACGLFEGDRLKDVADEMDLTIAEVCELIDRAQSEWDKIKAGILPLKRKQP